MSTFIQKEVLQELMSNEEIRIVDCRFQLGKPDEGKSQYLLGSIPGAVYFHLEEDLSAKVEKHGGRHPLPDLEQFKSLLEEAGISNDTKVVGYDNGEGAFAARLWWLLTYIGHDKVYILDGGFKGWQHAGLPVTQSIPNYKRGSYTLNVQQHMLAAHEEVREAVLAKNHVLIDSREEKRYLGIEEPIDKKAGHIPSAINKVWTNSFEDGKFKTPSEQEKRFADIEKTQPIIVYCGSGITATPNFIALKEAGYTNVKLYGGSFSDWISYDDNEIVSINE